MTHSRLAVQLAALVRRLGLEGAAEGAAESATKNSAETNAEFAVTMTFGAAPVPARIEELFDAILAGRPTDGPVPCPGGYPAGVEGLTCVLGDLNGRLRYLHGAWEFPRLNLALRMTTEPGSYTLTTWVIEYPPITRKLATLLHRLGLTAIDDDLYADIHEIVVDYRQEREPLAIVDVILDRRFGQGPADVGHLPIVLYKLRPLSG
jgi:hypothetical protein